MEQEKEINRAIDSDNPGKMGHEEVGHVDSLKSIDDEESLASSTNLKQTDKSKEEMQGCGAELLFLLKLIIGAAVFIALIWGGCALFS